MTAVSPSFQIRWFRGAEKGYREGEMAVLAWPDDTEMVALCAAKRTTEIAEHLQCSVSAVHKRLRAIGVRLPRHKRERANRPMCSVDGCCRQVEQKGTYGGRPIYRSKCGLHYRGHRRRMNTRRCSHCGWSGSCHRHRIVAGKDGGGYVVGNILVLCPNCHSAAHGNGTWNLPQYP